MPESEQPKEAQDLMLQAIIERDPKRVLDVGAGAGKWGRLLKDRGFSGKVVACEVWLPYVWQYGLVSVYDEVRIVDVRKIDDWDRFDVVILGDILEHMSRADGEALTRLLKDSKPDVFLTIPVTYCPQGMASTGNPFEIHLDQWSDEELQARGWYRIHVGPNRSGLVQIGTYLLRKDSQIEPVQPG